MTIAVALPTSNAVARINQDANQATTKAEAELPFAAIIEQGKLSGALLAADNGEVVFHQAFGVADPAGTPLTLEHRFEIASVTKPLTAMAVVRLAASGRLSLDDAVAQHLPKFPHADVTVRQLLNHSAGFPVHSDVIRQHVGIASVASFDALLEPVMDGRVQPTGKFVYSNVHYWLLSAVIENVTQQSYAEAMHTLL
ncbi:MAG: serine hydrolase domain-containing protein, partial [Planctomycetota bacterium]